MRTVTFKSVMESLLALRGHDPSQVTDFNVVPFVQYAVHIGRRVREGWEHAWFPEWTLVEERTVETDGVISLAQTGEVQIGTVREVWSADYRTDSGARRLPYRVTSAGIQTELDAADTCFPEFRKRAPRFTTVPYASGGNYQQGNVVYWPTSADGQLYGDCYEARLTEAGGFEWVKQEIPWVLEQWVIQAAFADALMLDGQRERALQLLGTGARPELERAVLTEIGQQGLTERVRVVVG